MVELYWIEGPGPGRVGVMPRPYGGDALEDDLRDLKRQEVGTLVSCLERSEVERYALEREGELCRALGIDFLSYPIPDHTAPKEMRSTSLFARGLAERVRRGEGVMVHCLAGIGRSPTIAGAVLLSLGERLDDVLRRMSDARGYPVPEMPEQYAWMERYADGIRNPESGIQEP
jgi:protein-tyrosine phosphatase